MSAEIVTSPKSKITFWTGWVLSLLVAAALVFSGISKFTKPDADGQKMLANIGWNESQMPGLGILEISCVVIFLIPQTTVLGAVLLTGYMGGAIATHVRIGDFGIVPHIIIGLLIWGALWLREPRLRALLPIRS